MCGSNKQSAPPPDPNQMELEQEQLKVLKEQQDEIHGFQPFVLQQYGLQSASTGSKADDYKAKQGEIAGFQKYIDSGINAGGVANSFADTNYYKQRIAKANDELRSLETTYEYTPDQIAKNNQLKAIQDQQLAVQTANNARIQDALAGKIGPSDALTRQKNLDFQTLMNDENNKGNEIMGDSLDNATAKTTSGQQALSALKTTYGALQSGEINNIINGAPAVSGMYQAQYMGGNPNAASLAMGGTLGPLGGISPQLSAAYQPYQYQQLLQSQANASNAGGPSMLTGLLAGGASGAAAGSVGGPWGAAIGGVVGAGLGAYNSTRR